MTRKLHDADHDFLPVIECSHVPASGELTLIRLTLTFTSQDFEAAMAVPPIFNIRFLPFKDILLLFLFVRKSVAGLPIGKPAAVLTDWLAASRQVFL